MSQIFADQLDQIDALLKAEADRTCRTAKALAKVTGDSDVQITFEGVTYDPSSPGWNEIMNFMSLEPNEEFCTTTSLVVDVNNPNNQEDCDSATFTLTGTKSNGDPVELFIPAGYAIFTAGECVLDPDYIPGTPPEPTPAPAPAPVPAPTPSPEGLPEV